MVIKDVIILKKVKEKKKMLESPANTIALAHVIHTSNFVDLTWNYKWPMSKSDIDEIKKLGLTRIKKYWRHAS